MAEANLIINVSNKEHRSRQGLAGEFVIPPTPPGMKLSLLVIYPVPEIQNIGDGRVEIHWLKSRPLAENIVGLHSEYPLTKWGIALCGAEPDLPKSLLKAIEEEKVWLDEHIPTVRYRKDKKSGALCAVNQYEEGEVVRRENFSLNIIQERDKFYEYCRGQVSELEVKKALAVFGTEDARLVAEADMMWAGNESAKRNIGNLHREACLRRGQQKPWCYTPEVLVDCPGCGGKMKENVLTCPNCHCLLDRDLAEYAKMSREERARALYPERYQDEPVKPVDPMKQPIYPKK